MPVLKHIDAKGYPYFVTTKTKANRKVFSDRQWADILLTSISYGRENGWYLLLSFVIMPDHMHLLIVPQTRNISQIVKAIKGYSARLINLSCQDNGSIWQEGFYDYVLDSDEKLLTKIKYVEENPVRAGLVCTPELYLYSSAYGEHSTDIDVYLSGAY